jgi:hypothetical protein
MFRYRQHVGFPSLIAGFAFIVAATTSVARPAGANSRSQSPTAVRVSERCPVGADAVGSTGQSYSVTIIENNLGTVRVYGESQPDTYSAVKAEWAKQGNDPSSDFSGVVVVAFTDRLQQHADALAKLVARPETVVVCKGRTTDTEMRTIMRELAPKLTGVGGYGAQFDVISVSLPGTQEQLAKELFDSYGNKIRIALGWFTYPDRTKVRDCGVVPPTVSSKLLGLKKGTTVRAKSGESYIRFKVQFTTASTGVVDFFGGVDAVIAKPGSNVIVARMSGPVIALGVSGFVTKKNRTCLRPAQVPIAAMPRWGTRFPPDVTNFTTLPACQRTAPAATNWYRNHNRSPRFR